MPSPSRRTLLRRFATVGSLPALSGEAASRRSSDRPSGAVEWKRTYGDGDYQCHGLTDLDEGVLLVGRTGSGRSETPWIASVDAAGEPRWTTTVDAPGFAKAVDAVPVDDGLTVLGTTDESPSLWMVTLGDDGRERWRHTAEGPHFHGIRTLAATDDGYLVAGFRGHPAHVNADLDAWARALDSAGDVRWERTYDGSAVVDVGPLDGGYLLTGTADGDAWLQAVDPDGEPRWRHTYGGVDSERAHAAVPGQDGVVYAGATESIRDAPERGMIVRTTADGKFVWRRTLEHQYVADLVPDGDGFAVTGEPPNSGRHGRDPEKPLTTVDRWGRPRQTVTVSVDPGAAVGVVRFGDGGLGYGGWSRDGIWLAKVDLGGEG